MTLSRRAEALLPSLDDPKLMNGELFCFTKGTHGATLAQLVKAGKIERVGIWYRLVQPDFGDLWIE